MIRTTREDSFFGDCKSPIPFLRFGCSGFRSADFSTSSDEFRIKTLQLEQPAFVNLRSSDDYNTTELQRMR